MAAWRRPTTSEVQIGKLVARQKTMQLEPSKHSKQEIAIWAEFAEYVDIGMIECPQSVNNSHFPATLKACENSEDGSVHRRPRPNAN